MKKKSLKLELRKMNVSNLSNIQGGGPKEVYTFTQAGNLCCPSIEETQTQLTTCWSGTPQCDIEPTGYCLTHEPTCVCFLSEGLPCY